LEGRTEAFFHEIYKVLNKKCLPVETKRLRIKATIRRQKNQVISKMTI